MRAALRRHRTGVVVTTVVLLVVVALSVLTLRSVPRNEDLDPDNPQPEGARAVARVLADRGVDVEVARGADALDAASIDRGTTVVVTSTDRLGRTTAQRLERSTRDAGALVVTEPGATALRELQLPATPEQPRLLRTTRAGCDDPLVGDLTVQPGPTEVYRPVGAASRPVTGCFTSSRPRPASVVLRVDAEPTTYVVAASGLLSNGSITDADNAAAALRLLGQHGRLVWYVADADDVAVGDAGSFSAQLPRALVPGSWLVAAALLATVLWRGRRLGPLVTEPLPVAVKAVESTQGRGRLYRRVRDRDHVAGVLRAATVRRLAARLRLPRDTTAADLVPAAAGTTGRDPHDLHDLLVTRRVDDDAALTRLAGDLVRLEREVHRP